MPASPYCDCPQNSGFSTTISAPYTHVSAAKALLPYLHENARILYIGAGSGYLTAVPTNLLSPWLGCRRLWQDHHSLSYAHQHCLHYLITFYWVIHRQKPSPLLADQLGRGIGPIHCYYKLEELQSLARKLASI